MIDNEIVEAYSQAGGALPYFVGKQYGNGWMKTIGRFAFPILKKVFNVASSTAEDVVMKDKPWMNSLKRNAVKEIFNPSTITTAMQAINSPSTTTSSTTAQPPPPPPTAINSSRKRRLQHKEIPPFYAKNNNKRRKTK